LAHVSVFAILTYLMGDVHLCPLPLATPLLMLCVASGLSAYLSATAEYLELAVCFLL